MFLTNKLQVEYRGHDSRLNSKGSNFKTEVRR